MDTFRAYLYRKELAKESRKYEAWALLAANSCSFRLYRL
jgi:hypothetical protein